MLRMCRFNVVCDSLIILRFIYSICLDGAAEMEINKSLEMLKLKSCIVVAPLKMAECCESTNETVTYNTNGVSVPDSGSYINSK